MIIALPAAVVGLSVVRLGLLASLHVVDRGNNPIRDAVSEYAIGPARRLSAAMTWCTAVTWAVLALATWFALPHWDRRGTATILLAALAAIFVVLPLVPTEDGGTARTLRGKLHYLLAIAWFAIAYDLTGDFARLAARSWGGAIAGMCSVLHWVSLVSLIALVAFLLLKPLRKYFGLAERVFLIAISLFFLIAAAGMLVHGVR